MNNVLDTDKLSVPVWAMTAMVSSLYIYSAKKTQNKDVKQTEEKEIFDNNLLISNTNKI